MSLRACTTCGVQKSDSNFASAFTLICNACALNAQSGAMGKLDFSGLDVTRSGDSFTIDAAGGAQHEIAAVGSASDLDQRIGRRHLHC